ncbi:MAG: hypothetical protein AAGD38_23560 [Acidobacteriota bacterium]
MTYTILDEPSTGGKLGDFAVRPLWPLLAVMFGGAWLSWPWFAFNAWAVGSPTRRRETALAAAGFVGAATLFLVLAVMNGNGLIPEGLLPYLGLVLTVWKLFISYRLYLLQARSFYLYEYFGGAVRSGLFVVLIGGFARIQVLSAVPVFWQAVLS